MAVIQELAQMDAPIGDLKVIDALIITDVDHIYLTDKIPDAVPFFDGDSIRINRDSMLANSGLSAFLVAYVNPGLANIDTVFTKHHGELVDYWGTDGSVLKALRSAHRIQGEDGLPVVSHLDDEPAP